jgi:PAS domain S-box-containing protein
VLGASQALSESLRLDDLLPAVLRILLASAGADRAWLLRAEEGVLTIRARGTVAGEQTLAEVIAPEAGQVGVSLPQRMLNLVQRTDTPLLIDAPDSDPRFAGDPYFATHHPRSALCLPISRGGQGIGLLYLENSLTGGAFVQERMGVLRALAIQVAISIENAELYARSQAEVAQRKRAQDALRQSEERYRTLVEHLPAITYVRGLGAKGSFVYLSPQIESLLGFTPAEWAADPQLWSTHLHPDDHARVVELEAHFQATGEPLRAEYRYLARDGHTVWFEEEAVLERDASGQPLYKHGMMLDITARKQAEEVLRQREAQFRLIYEHAPIGMALLDDQGRPLVTNKRLHDFVGYTAEELRGMVFTEFTHPDDRSADWMLYEELVAGTRDSYTLDRRYIHKDGHIVWGSLAVSATRDPEGRIQSLIGMVNDVTEHKRAEEALRTSEEQYRRIVETSQEGIVHVDAFSRIVYANRRFAEVLGYRIVDVIGRPVATFATESGTAVIEAAAVRRRAGDAGHFHYDVELRHKEGSIVWVSVSSIALLDAAGGSLGTLAMMQDITERKRAEDELLLYKNHLEETVARRTAELARARDAAEVATRAKSAFLANMSHEIRTPMNAVLGFTQLLMRDSALTQTQRQHVEVISRSGEHLITLINDVLELAKIEAGRATVNVTTCDLHALLADLDSLFRLPVEEKGLFLSVERGAAVPRFVTTDEAKLRQVLINLLGNAVKFTAEGGITLRVNMDWDTAQQPRLVAEVEDSGPGIADEELGLLFQSFSQTSAGAGRGGGTGLGLAISQEYARLLGGEIRVTSRLGYGSVFRVEIAGVEGAPPSQEQQEGSRWVVGLQPGQAAWRVLIADDREDNRVLLTRLLDGVGIETREVANGRDALHEYTAWRPHMILMDMRMPVIDGYEAMRRLRATEGGRAVKIIGVTASAFEEDRQGVLAAGADGYLAKPFRAETLFDLLSRHLGIEFSFAVEHGAAPAASPPPPRQMLVPSPMATTQGEGGSRSVEDVDSDLLAPMREATLRGDLTRILELTDQLAVIDAPRARRLREFAARFDYAALLAHLGAEGEG